jgi:hypothetical protein
MAGVSDVKQARVASILASIDQVDRFGRIRRCPRMADGATIGVHSASLRAGGGTVRSDLGNILLANYYLSLGLKPAAVALMVTPNPDEMLWLTPKIADVMGITYRTEKF